ncbi:MAG TPA: hypothetical protein VM428_09210 [Microlunatus sp.]|nr:hypothetical protein [Microlunatus sp.]
MAAVEGVATSLGVADSLGSVDVAAVGLALGSSVADAEGSEVVDGSGCDGVGEELGLGDAASSAVHTSTARSTPEVASSSAVVRFCWALVTAA